LVEPVHRIETVDGDRARPGVAVVGPAPADDLARRIVAEADDLIRSRR
jgi:hypothetical protein